MTQAKRILIVDDSVVIRRMVGDVIDADPALAVVGTAANGKIALEKIALLEPDLVTLDVEMPEMDGLQTLAALRRTHPRLPVIMFSTMTDRGAATTVEALVRGANDYVTKPANVGSVAAALERVRSELIPKVKDLCGVQEALPHRPRAPLAARSRTARAHVRAIVIGVSTGGPNALAELLPRLPATLRAPVFVVQHMPPMFTRLLGERLDAQSPLAVAEAGAATPVGPGQAWIAPGDRHMVVRADAGRVVVDTNQQPAENSCRPAADVLFRSAAQVYGAGVLAVVLTGMGQDAFRGCEHIRAQGGSVIVQDEASSVVWGMPGAVVRAGLADAVLPLDRIAAEIIQRTTAPGQRVGDRSVVAR